MHNITKKHRDERKKYMYEIIKDYIGKDCIIYTMQGSAAVDGIVENVADGWITLKTPGTDDVQAINLEYVTRVRVYPVDKNGKRKTIFA